MKKNQIEINKMLIAVNRVKAYMLEHGIFTLLQYKGGMFRVFQAPCDCPGNKISGLLFYKWAKRNRRCKKFERLIVHIVCYKCSAKSPMEIFEPPDYDFRIKDNKLWKRFGITTKQMIK